MEKVMENQNKPLSSPESVEAFQWPGRICGKVCFEFGVKRGGGYVESPKNPYNTSTYLITVVYHGLTTKLKWLLERATTIFIIVIIYSHTWQNCNREVYKTYRPTTCVTWTTRPP